MDTKITGIINPGDTREIKKWVEQQIGSLSDRKNEIAEIKTEIALLRLGHNPMNAIKQPQIADIFGRGL